MSLYAYVSRVNCLYEPVHHTAEIIEKRNSAAAGLCSWVVNIVNYYDIVITVEPKRILLRQLLNPSLCPISVGESDALARPHRTFVL